MYLSRNTRRVGLLRNKLQHVELWTTRRGLSGRLRQRIRAYYAKVWLNHAGGFADLLLTCAHSEIVIA